MRRRVQESLAAYLFLLPFLLLLAIFFAYATVRAFIFSFTNYDLFHPAQFVGLKNYVDLFRDGDFIAALRNSVLFSILVTVLQTFFALVMASALNTRLRGIHFFRAAYYLPSITSSVVITLIFMWLFQRRGLINYLTQQVASYLPQLALFLLLTAALQAAQVAWERRRGLPAGPFDPALLAVSLMIGLAVTLTATLLGYLPPRSLPPVETVWLASQQSLPRGFPFWLSLPRPLVAIMIQNIFTTVPTFMLMFLAALQDVPKTHYEAAAIDGATTVQQFFYITIPSVRPVTFLVVTLSLIGTLQMFDQVAIFGDAAPLRSVITLAYFVYNRMFPGAQTPQVGFAAAAAMFLALFTLALVLLQRLFLRAEGD